MALFFALLYFSWEPAEVMIYFMSKRNEIFLLFVLLTVLHDAVMESHEFFIFDSADGPWYANAGGSFKVDLPR